MIRKCLLTFFLVCFFATTLESRRLAADPTPNADRAAAQQWFRDAKFGMFIHWGVYSVLKDGVWVMNRKKIPLIEYEKLPPQFNPTEFDAAEWVSLAKAAGAKYITITSKHHDGFAMFDTQQSDWDIVDRTPWKKDPLKLLSDECQKQGIKLFFYYSQLDWHHPDYFPLGSTGHTTGRPSSGDWYQYLDYMDAQLTELLTNYGAVGGIWFDGMWDKRQADWRLEKTYSLIHRLQPAAMIGSNHHVMPFPEEDFQMFEKDLPGHSTQSYNVGQPISSLPREICETIASTTWGYSESDKQFKSPAELIQYLVRAAGYDSNFLLNVGPMPNGKIQPEFIERMKAIGAWLEKNGETVYGTRGGPVEPRPWGVTTRKGNTVYVHILDWKDNALLLPKFGGNKIKSAALFATGEKVKVVEASYGTVLVLPASSTDGVDNIVVVQLM